ncbi:MAG: lytic murein transglycosylase, partial [Candidatus Berkiella sp.]
HTVLATASYNAGPTRTLQWLPPSTQEADIWIETIPYRETREYVKNVLTFTGIYRQRLGYPPAFALLMKPIPNKA